MLEILPLSSSLTSASTVKGNIGYFRQSEASHEDWQGCFLKQCWEKLMDEDDD